MIKQALIEGCLAGTGLTLEPGETPNGHHELKTLYYFRYGRAHFALDALDSYKTAPDNPGRMIPNPAKKAVERAGAKRDARLAELKDPAPGTTVVITNKTLARLGAPVETARRKVQAARNAAAGRVGEIPISQRDSAMVRLDTETKLITHAIRMAAFNAEVMLARALHGHYARAGDEAGALYEPRRKSGQAQTCPATGPGQGRPHVPIPPEPVARAGK